MKTQPSTPETLLLTRGDVETLLTMDECIEAVDRAFRDAAIGLTPPARSLGFPSGAGGFHVKIARTDRGSAYLAAKLNGNFPNNRPRGLPAIQGVVVLSDAEDGRVLALMDSISITTLRTGAATAVAARALARDGPATVAIIGCGNQGRVSLRALRRVRDVRRVLVWDRELAAAETLAATADPPGLAEIAPDVRSATTESDIVVTCTPSREPLLFEGDVRPGTFVAAVGADSEEKSEIHPQLMAQGAIVVDNAEQCAQIGDLHHAIQAGTCSRASVRAELGDVLARRRPGRVSAEEIVVFDSTGTALQDVALAALVYERAVRRGGTRRINLAAEP